MTTFVNSVLTFLVIVFFFVIEALIHYNIGLNGNRTFAFHIPPRKQMFEILATVAIFAGLSTLATEVMNHYLNKYSSET